MSGSGSGSDWSSSDEDEKNKSTVAETVAEDKRRVAKARGANKGLFDIQKPPDKKAMDAARSGGGHHQSDEGGGHHHGHKKKQQGMEGGDPTALFRIPGLQTRVISAEEIKQSFDAIDIDGNTSLDSSDLRYMLNLAGEEATDEEITEMIRIIDHDASGEVGYEEFHSLFADPPLLFKDPRLNVVKAVDVTMGENKRTVLDSTERAQIMKEFVGTGMISTGYLKQAFQRFQDVDVDGGGSINYEEFLQVVDREDDPVSTKLFEMFDTDDSGDVDFREFVMAMANLTTQTQEDKIKMAFALFDNDCSGFIEQDELYSIIRMNPAYVTASDEEIKIICESLYRGCDMITGASADLNDFQRMVIRSPEILGPVFNAISQLEGTMGLAGAGTTASASQLAKGESELSKVVKEQGGDVVSLAEARNQMIGDKVKKGGPAPGGSALFKRSSGSGAAP